jgi:hypothetical protein
MATLSSRGWKVLALLMMLQCPDLAAQGLRPMTAPPEWSSGCDAKTKDQFGDKKRSYCWLFVNNLGNPGQIMDDNAYVIKHETLFEIDGKGLHLRRPKKVDRLCKGEPKRIAVDGIRIDHLFEAKQIEAILAGNRLVWEKQAKWPYCGIAPHGTYLTGVREAVAELRAKWAARPR